MAYIWDYFSAGRIDAVGDNINDMAPTASIRPAKKEPESKSLALCKHPLKFNYFQHKSGDVLACSHKDLRNFLL